MKEDNQSLYEARNIELEKMKLSLELQLTEMTKQVREAGKDTLTGLRNRTGISEEINNHLEQYQSGTFLIMDLDNFKFVNDTYGHKEGDTTLKKVADTLNKYCSEEEIIARIGGDEFIVFIPKKKTKKEIAQRAQKLVKEIEKNLVNPGRLNKVTTSVGIAMAPHDGLDFDTLYGHSDIALYESKHKGKNRYHFYDEIVVALNSNLERGKASLGEIIHKIRESEMEGSFIVEYESFEKIYRFIERNIVREKKEVSCVLLSAEEIEDNRMLKISMQNLQNQIVSVLRKGDVITHYSDSQMLVLLMDANKENAQKVIDRILEKYRTEEKELALDVTYEISELEGDKAAC